jgi:hypothetical protein
MVENLEEFSLSREQADAKKPYQKPRIVHRERLEVSAVVCTPGKADVASCPSGPIES